MLDVAELGPETLQLTARGEEARGASSLATVATIACPHCCCLLIQKNYKGSQATMKSEIITPSVHNSTPPWE